MMRTRPVAPVVLGVVLAAACSSSPPPEAKPAPTPTQTATAAQPPPLDLSPVPEPAGIVASIRGRSLDSLVDGWTSCTKMSSTDVQKGVEMGVHELAKDLFGRERGNKLVPVVALNAPIDVIFAANPTDKKDPVHVAVAFGVTSLENAKAALEDGGELHEKGAGVWDIKPKSERAPRCALFASAGTSPGRVVCSEKDAHLMALGPYMARTLAGKSPSGSGDLHGALSIKAIDASAGKQLRDLLELHPSIAAEAKTGEGSLDKAVGAAAKGLAAELGLLLGDIDQLAFDASLDKNQCGSLSVSLGLVGTKSWTAQLLAERPERQRPAPAQFWRLPKDAASASYSVAGDPALLQPVVKTVKELIDGALTLAKVGTAADRKAVTDLLDVNLGKDVVSVSAMGGAGSGTGSLAFLTAIRKSDDKRDPKKMQSDLDTLVKGLVPWGLAGVDKKGDVSVKWMKDFAAAYGRKPIQDALKKAVGPSSKFHLPVIKVGAAPGKLPKGSTMMEIKLSFDASEPAPPPMPAVAVPAPPPGGAKPKAPPPAPKPKASKPIVLTATLYLIAMPDGEESWIGYGTDKDEIVKRLLAAKSGAPVGETLASRNDLAPLKTKSALFGGFFSGHEYVNTAKVFAAEAKKEGKTKEAKAIEDALAKLPHGGNTPAFVFGTFDGPSKRASVTLEVQRGTFEDLGSAIDSALQVVKRGGP